MGRGCLKLRDVIHERAPNMVCSFLLIFSSVLGPFAELAELVYMLSLLSNDCLTNMKYLWSNQATSPAFEQPLTIFKAFGTSNLVLLTTYNKQTIKQDFFSVFSVCVCSNYYFRLFESSN
jgi:hypothetical protein